MWTIFRKDGFMFKNGFKMVRSGFTLAEVLITLGIIGVVAAMTMPTLINATNGAQYKTAFKKALSVISQAVVLNLALDEYDFGRSVDGTGDGSIYKLLDERMNIVDRKDAAIANYSPLLGATSTQTAANLANNYTFFFNDGVMFTFPKTAKDCTEDNVIDSTTGKIVQNTLCRGFIDVNGLKQPNRQAICNTVNGEQTKGDDCVVDTVDDIFPVVFYDQGIYPASDAGRAVLYKK